MREQRPGGAAGALAGLVCGLGVGIPELAQACSSCFTGGEAEREAYYQTTLLLIAVPVLLLGSIGIWLRRAARRRERAGSAS